MNILTLDELKVKAGTDKEIREFRRCFLPGGECNNKCPLWVDPNVYGFYDYLQSPACAFTIIAAALLTISKK